MVSYEVLEDNGTIEEEVLILIVVEDGLVQGSSRNSMFSGGVLILIVVEDGLVPKLTLLII